MKIGILHEGKLDLLPVQTIVEKIIKPIHEGDIYFKSFNAHGEIISSMNPALTYFKVEEVDIALFVTDIDDYPKRRVELRDFIKEHEEIKIIPVFCEPHFEEWFILEKNAITQVLDLHPEYSLKSHPLRTNPKKLVDRLINERSKKIKETLFEADVYLDISKILNLKGLARKSSDFKHFNEELTKHVKLSQ